jgi:hypothetical protein
VLGDVLTPVGQDSSNSFVTNLGFGLGFLMLPIGAGIGVLRYKLYDIDILINRALVYGPVTAILAALYGACVFGAQAAVGALTRTSQENQPLIIVATTLLVAALIQPLRIHVQALVDRRFYRRKYDAAQTLASFGAALRTQTRLGDLHEHLVTVITETMQPDYVSLWLHEPQDREGGRQ